MTYKFLIVTLFNILIILAWLVLIAFALIRLRRLDLPSTAKAVWALSILVIPVLGATAFFFITGRTQT